MKLEFPNLHLFGFCNNNFEFVRSLREVDAINTCIMFCNMSCFVGSLKFSSIFQLGVVTKFVAC
jgi:hypothetical protein